MPSPAQQVRCGAVAVPQVLHTPGNAVAKRAQAVSVHDEVCRVDSVGEFECTGDGFGHQLTHKS